MLKVFLKIYRVKLQSYFTVAFFSLALFFVAPHFSQAAVIFEDNFDAQADWQPRPAGITNDAAPSGGVIACDPSGCVTPAPTGWDYYRATGWWWGPTYQDTLRITDLAGRGGAGKAFIVHNEANNGSAGDGWGADGILAKKLDTEVPELYTRFYVRTQANWAWQMNNRIGVKVFRIGHYMGTGDYWRVGTSGNKAPLTIFDFMNSAGPTAQLWGTELSSTLRCGPPASYMCANSPAGQAAPQSLYFKTDAPGGTKYLITDDPHTTGLWGDTNWHRYDIHVKMNTYVGDGTWNADGVYELWYDGILQQSISNVKWQDTGTDGSVGWNTVEMGGNANNLYTAVENHGEQWYALDDVVISTTAIPADYIIAGGDTVAPSAPTGLGVM